MFIKIFTQGNIMSYIINKNTSLSWNTINNNIRKNFIDSKINNKNK